MVFVKKISASIPTGTGATSQYIVYWLFYSKKYVKGFITHENGYKIKTQPNLTKYS